MGHSRRGECARRSVWPEYHVPWPGRSGRCGPWGEWHRLRGYSGTEAAVVMKETTAQCMHCLASLAIPRSEMLLVPNSPPCKDEHVAYRLADVLGNDE